MQRQSLGWARGPRALHPLAVFGEVAPEHLLEHGFRPVERNPVLGAARPGKARHDRGQVEGESLGVARSDRRVVPQGLLFGVGLDQRDLLGSAAREAQVAERLVIDREDGAGGPVLRGWQIPVFGGTTVSPWNVLWPQRKNW